ncbi:hypothetical protein J2X61_005360 [Bacillus sp. 3255]|nr:hypothetical protein [Bacillus sp. 3255]
MKQHIDNVHDIIQNSAGTYRKFQEDLRREIRNIELDTKYSQEW